MKKEYEYERTNRDNLLEIPMNRQEWKFIFGLNDELTRKEKNIRDMFIIAESKGIFSLCGWNPIQVHDVKATCDFFKNFEDNLWNEYEEKLDIYDRMYIKNFSEKLLCEVAWFMNGIFESLYKEQI